MASSYLRCLMAYPSKTEQEHWLQGTKTHAPKPSAFAGGKPRVPKNSSPLARRAYKRAVQRLENRKTQRRNNTGNFCAHLRAMGYRKRAANVACLRVDLYTTVVANRIYSETLHQLEREATPSNLPRHLHDFAHVHLATDGF